MSVYLEKYIFFIDTNFVEHNRHYLSTLFLVEMRMALALNNLQRLICH